MEKPKINMDTEESYNALKAYAEYLTAQLSTSTSVGDDMIVEKMNVRFAWKDVNEMAVSLSRSYASRSREAFNMIVNL